MAINFPFSPKIDQIYTQGNLSWQWNGIEWVDYISVIDNLNISNALSIGGKITGYNSIKISNGQILIGNALSGSFESATLTGGSGIDIANDSGSITITANVAAISGAISVVNASGINGSINSGVLTLSVSAGAFANTVSNGGGITGFITGGGVLTLGSNGSSANGASTIVTRGADGSFSANIITATLYGAANTVTTNAQSNITSVGTLTSLTSSGVVSITNASAATNTTTGALRVTGGISTQNTMYAAGGHFDGVNRTLALVTNGGGITGTISGNTLTLGSNGSSANGASTIVTRGAGGSFSANIITATLYGAANSATTAGTVTTNAQPNITSVGTLASLNVTANISGAATFSNTLTVTGESTLANTIFRAGSIELNNNGTGDRNSFIDFHSDDTYTDYSFRMIAAAGANGLRQITARGTGGIEIRTEAAGFISFVTNNTERMKIDSSGRVTMPFQPAFIAKGLAAQTTYTRGQVVVFNSAAYNVGSSYNTANGRFTAPVAGLYAFTFQLYLNPGNTNAPMCLVVNGTVQIFFLQEVAINGIGLSTQIYLAASDYVEVRVRDVAGATATIFNGADHTQFTGHLIG